MRNRDFKRLRGRKSDQEIKEEYMVGKYSSLTDRQLDIICEGSGTGRGGAAFKYKPKKKKEEESKKGFNILGIFKKKEIEIEK